MVNQKILGRGLPGNGMSFFIHPNSASGDDEVEVGMIDHRIPAPRLQDTKIAELTITQVSRYRRHITKRLGSCTKERPIPVALAGAQRHPQFLRNREGDQEVMHRQQLGRLFFQPLCRLVNLTRRAVAGAARASDPVPTAATVALVEDTA